MTRFRRPLRCGTLLLCATSAPSYLAGATTDRGVVPLTEPEVDCGRLRPPIPLAPPAMPTSASGDASLFVWTGGGSGGMGNAFVGYLTSFYDAMRSGRRLVRLSTPEFTFSDLAVAFDLGGLPLAEESVEFDEKHVRRQHPQFHCEYYQGSGRANVSFVFHKQTVPGPATLPIVQSRHNNVHFDRPRGPLEACHFEALGCHQPPRGGININKQVNGRHIGTSALAGLPHSALTYTPPISPRVRPTTPWTTAPKRSCYARSCAVCLRGCAPATPPSSRRGAAGRSASPPSSPHARRRAAMHP